MRSDLMKKVRRGSRCRNVTLTDAHVSTQIRVGAEKKKEKRGRQFSEVDWKANAQKFQSGGEWKAELTRQVSYAVHWSPSHFHPHLRNVKFFPTTRITLLLLLFLFLLYYWQWKEEKNLFHFNFDAYKLGKSLHYIRFIRKTALDNVVAAVGIELCVCTNDGGFTQQNYEQNT